MLELCNRTIDNDAILNNRFVDAFRKLIPSKMYHVTPTDRLSSILSSGLKLDSPRNSTKGHIFGIYLTSNPGELFFLGEYSVANHTVLEVVTTGRADTLRIDSEFYQSPEHHGDNFIDDLLDPECPYDLVAYSTTPIPPEALRVIDLTEARRQP